MESQVDQLGDMVRVEMPWTAEQVVSLNDYQQHGMGPKYTCGNRRHRRGVPLVATSYGWACEGAGEVCCDFGQVWAHGFTADGTWRDMDTATMAFISRATSTHQRKD